MKSNSKFQFLITTLFYKSSALVYSIPYILIRLFIIPKCAKNFVKVKESAFARYRQAKPYHLFFLALFFMQKVGFAQVTMQNNGALFVTNSSDIVFLNGTLNNATTASLTNNGNFYISQDVNNFQPAMATGTGTLYLNGTIPQAVNGTQTFKTFNLQTNNSTGFTLNNNLSVTGVHSYINGLITTSAVPNFMVYESGAAYNGTDDSKHVNGWVKKRGTTDFIFPVGNAVYLRTLALTSLGANSEFNVKYNNGPTPNYINLLSPLVLVDTAEYWTVNKILGTSARVTMTWDNSKVPVPQVITGNIRAAYYNGSLWTNIGGSGTGSVTTTGAVTSNSTISFNNNFTLGSTALVLPISIINFSGARAVTANKINWTIANEQHIQHYELQRSNDGINFTTITMMPAKNNNATALYTYDDVTSLYHKVFYRLRFMDGGAAVKYSGIVTIAPQQSAAREFYLLQNPVSNKIDLYTGSFYTGKYSYTLTAAGGQSVQSGQIDIRAQGVQTINITSHLPYGIYKLILTNGENVLSKSILKQ